MAKLSLPKPLGAFIILTLTAVLFLAALPLARAGDDALLIPLPGEVPQRDTAVLQAQRVAVNWAALTNPQAPQLQIPLFDGETITALHQRTDPSTAPGGFVWIGHIPGRPHSRVTLSVAGEALVGTISRDGLEQIDIAYNGRDHILQQPDPHRMLEAGPNDALLPPELDAPAAAEGPLCENGSVIDLMLAYTSEARTARGGKAGITALLNQRVADMNNANKASGLDFTYRLVKLYETNYKESGDVSKDLNRLVNKNDGLLDDVLQMRNTVKADLSALVIAESDTNMSCGIAYVMSRPSVDFAPFALNVTALDYAGMFSCSPLTLTHEFGHNMGNLHDRANTSYTPIYPYSYGFQAPDRAFRTLMAYPCSGGSCPQINQWSNPDIRYNRQPTGIDHAQTPGQSADNARSMSQAALYVSNFRPRCATQPAATPTPTATVTPTSTPTSMPTPQASATPTNTPQPTPAATRPLLDVTPTPAAGWRFTLPLVLGR